MSTAETTTQTEAPATRTRQRRKAEYWLQVQGDHSNDWNVVSGTGPFTDAAAAKKEARLRGEDGHYRIVRVVDQFTAKKETKTVTKLT